MKLSDLASGDKFTVTNLPNEFTFERVEGRCYRAREPDGTVTIWTYPEEVHLCDYES